MTNYYYINVNSRGLIVGTFESSKEASSDQSNLIRVDSYDPENCGRFYLNEAIIPAPPEPSEGYYWEWNGDTGQFEEVLIPTENAE